MQTHFSTLTRYADIHTLTQLLIEGLGGWMLHYLVHWLEVYINEVVKDFFFTL